MEMHPKLLSAKWHPFCPVGDELNQWGPSLWVPVHRYTFSKPRKLTHWGRVTHICVGKLTIIGSDNGLSPGRRQAIIWTNAGILLIGPLATKFSENLIRIQIFSFKKMHLKMSSAKLRLFCLGLNVLTHCGQVGSWVLVSQHWFR